MAYGKVWKIYYLKGLRPANFTSLRRRLIKVVRTSHCAVRITAYAHLSLNNSSRKYEIKSGHCVLCYKPLFLAKTPFPLVYKQTVFDTTSFSLYSRMLSQLFHSNANLQIYHRLQRWRFHAGKKKHIFNSYFSIGFTTAKLVEFSRVGSALIYRIQILLVGLWNATKIDLRHFWRKEESS